jgi:hypothetical protein
LSAELWRNVTGRRYRRWTEADGELLDDAVEEWTEIGPDGRVLREIAFDGSGRVVHLMPSDRYRDGTYGHFDLSPADISGPDTIGADEFERRWEQARRAAELLPRPPSDIEAAASRLALRFNRPGWSDNLALLIGLVLAICGVAVIAFGVLHAAGWFT